MSLSTHYYVLSLGAETSTLFEAFRESLIDIENQGFPVVNPARASAFVSAGELQKLARRIDECFGHYYLVEPLKLVVVGEQEMQSAFSSVTEYGAAVVGRIEGDHTATPARDLGQIVWPVVREAMSGALEKAMRDVETAQGRAGMVTGLEAVARRANIGVRATLLVEENYHLRGSIGGVGGTYQSPVVSTDVDVRDAMDDAVDVVIEKVLASGGHVVFTPNGYLIDRDRIVLLPRDADEA